MATLSWGGPSLFQTAPSGENIADASWIDIVTPKEDTIKITVNAGNEITATEEGGAIVDVRYNANTYQLEFDEFVKKGGTPLFADVDGKVPGEHAFRLLPEDDACEGWLIDRSVVRVEQSYSTADGILRHHVCRGLKPAQGNTVKSYKKAGGQ